MLLQACLGIDIDGRSRKVEIRQPALPDGIERLGISQLPVGTTTIDLEVRRIGTEIVVAPSRYQKVGVTLLAAL